MLKQYKWICLGLGTECVTNQGGHKSSIPCNQGPNEIINDDEEGATPVENQN